MRPYRVRKSNNARLVRLAPGLPPVNLPPSVRVMSQSSFMNSQAAKDLGNIPSNMHLGVGSSVKLGPMRKSHVNVTASSQQRNHPDIPSNKCTVERGDSDLQMHPLLFQAPQDGHLPYYPSSSSTSSSYNLFSGKQPQLSLSLFHNPRHIRDAVNFLSKSSKPPEKNAAVTSGVDFHPLLQRTDNAGADSSAAHPAGKLSSIAASRQGCAPNKKYPYSTTKPSVDGTTSASMGTKASSLSRKSNELDLNIHLSFTSKNQEGSKSRIATLRDTSGSVCAPIPGVIEFKNTKGSSKKRDSAPGGISNELNSSDIPLVTSRNRGSRKVPDNMQDESLPEIVMEQEELSDSEEEFGENVEFECEEMADSEAESTSDSEQVVAMPNEVMFLYEVTCGFLGNGYPIPSVM